MRKEDKLRRRKDDHSHSPVLAEHTEKERRKETIKFPINPSELNNFAISWRSFEVLIVLGGSGENIFPGGITNKAFTL